MFRRVMAIAIMTLAALGIGGITADAASAAPTPCGGSPYGNGWFDVYDIGGIHHQAANCSVDYANGVHFCIDFHAGSNVSYCSLEMWGRPGDNVWITPNYLGYGLGFLMKKADWSGNKTPYGYWNTPAVNIAGGPGSGWTQEVAGQCGSWRQRLDINNVNVFTRNLGRLMAEGQNAWVGDIAGSVTHRKYGWNNGQPNGTASDTNLSPNCTVQYQGNSWAGYVPNN